MKIALDTNRYSDLAKDVAGVRDVIEHAAVVYLPFVVVAELRCGFVGGRRMRENENALTQFLSRPNVDVLYPDDATTHQYAAVHEQLRRQGTPIPTNDMWIAALTIQHGLHLYARDKHFAQVAQLPRL